MEFEKHFNKGTIARCNRCGAKFEMTKSSVGIQENDRVYRLQTMMTSANCGHMDAHWVYIQDLTGEVE